MLDKVFQLVVNGLIAGALLAVPAIGFTLIFAVLRFVNFATAGHMAVGAFAGYVLNAWLGLPAWLAVAGAFVVTAMIGIATDHVALRPLRGYSALTLAIASIALNLMIESTLRFAFGGAPRDYAIPLRRDWTLGPIHVGPQQVENAVIAIVAMAVLFLFLASTTTGKAMRAVADNPMLADSKGSTRTTWRGWPSASAWDCAASAACWSAWIRRSIRWSAFASSSLVFAAAVVGGLGSVPGAVVGGFAIGVAEEMSLLVFPATYKSAIGFLAILVILTLRPRGLLGARLA